MKKALICGVAGQDGAYLARLLLDKGYEVAGTSRDAATSTFRNLRYLGIEQQVTQHSMTLTDFRSVLQVVAKVRPDEIYNLAGQSSVALSFDQPVETLESVSLGVINLLEAVRFLGSTIRVYNAASGECFGNTGDLPANELTPFRPRSPYGVAKAAAFWVVANYREAYHLYACSGILFNHESPLRPERFVTKKIISAVNRIRSGSGEKLQLGELRVQRDWGWAPEYVEAMWLMLQQPSPSDYVIATGQSYTLQDFVAAAFAARGLDWRDHVVTNAAFLRPSDIMIVNADPSRAARELGWSAKLRMPDVVRMLLDEPPSGRADELPLRETARPAKAKSAL